MARLYFCIVIQTQPPLTPYTITPIAYFLLLTSYFFLLPSHLPPHNLRTNSH